MGQPIFNFEIYCPVIIVKKIVEKMGGAKDADRAKSFGHRPYMCTKYATNIV
jgi:hypothetical protein